MFWITNFYFIDKIRNKGKKYEIDGNLGYSLHLFPNVKKFFIFKFCSDDCLSNDPWLDPFPIDEGWFSIYFDSSNFLLFYSFNI